MHKTWLMIGALGLTGSVNAEAPRVVTVTAHDFRYEAPSSIPAGTVTFRLKNAGKEIHHLWVVQLAKGKTPAEFTAAMQHWGSDLRMPSWATDVGGPNSADPGQSADGTMTLEPGTYMLVCWIPSSDGMLHVMKGMVKTLMVTEKGSTPVAEPTADMNLTLDDYAFELSTPIKAGHHTIRVENRARQSHEVVIGRLHSGHAMKDAILWMNGGQYGPSPVTAIGGAAGLATGRHMYFTADFTPGTYVLLCFIPDVKDGKPHSDHGMIKEIVVAP